MENLIADAKTTVEDSSNSQEERFKNSIIDLLRNAILDGSTAPTKALQEVADITSRSIAAWHSWLVTRRHFPDAVSLFKVFAHYGIDIGGQEMRDALAIFNPSKNREDLQEQVINVPTACFKLTPLSKEANPQDLLRLYTNNHEYVVFLSYLGNDMEPHVRRGEVIAVDVSIESKTEDGIYLLQSGPNVYLRSLETNLFSGDVSINTVNSRTLSNGLIIAPDKDGLLPQIQIHGRVLGVLKGY